MSNNIKPPTFCPNAIPSKEGWRHPKTNELLIAIRGLKLPQPHIVINKKEPVIEKEEPVVEIKEPVIEKEEKPKRVYTRKKKVIE